MEEKLIKSESNFKGKEDLNLLREQFVKKYCDKKGWSLDSLTPDQLLEISQNKEYKTPGIILG